MPRFVILEHDHPFLHWDLLLESGDHAECWRLLRRPVPAEPIAAERLADHRLFYLDYEGPVSGDRGSVQRFDGGQFSTTSLASMSSWAGTRTERVLSLWDCAEFCSASLLVTEDDRQFWLFGSA